jgi:N-acetyl-alpha-D-glucosaminyl L-malate synthase BshA
MHEVVINEVLDLLHVHYAIPHATSAWIAKEMLRAEGRDISVITTLHGTDITIVGQDHSFHAITKFSIERSDRVTAVSEFLKEETLRAFGCSGCDVEVIHNFIDPAVYDRSRYDPMLRHQVGDGKKILMHISNFRPVKRVLDVVRAYAGVRREIPSALVMVGDGPDRSAAEEEARNLGIERDVHFLGRIDAVAPLLASADLFLLPSDRESFGLSALEALACGVPAIAYNVGGIREVIKDGETGALCTVADVDALVAAALALLGTPARWKQASEAAARDARARFSLDEIVGRYEQLYRRVKS